MDCTITGSYNPSAVVPPETTASLSYSQESTFTQLLVSPLTPWDEGHINPEAPEVGGNDAMQTNGLNPDPWNPNCPIVAALAKEYHLFSPPRVRRTESEEFRSLANWRPWLTAEVPAPTASETMHMPDTEMYEENVGEGDIAAGPAPFDGLSSAMDESVVDPQDLPEGSDGDTSLSVSAIVPSPSMGSNHDSTNCVCTICVHFSLCSMPA